MDWYKILESETILTMKLIRNSKKNINVENNENSMSNNFYYWYKNDIRKDYNFRKELFKNIKTRSIEEVEKNMLVLDSGATNSVGPYENLCFNVRLERSKLDCEGENEIKIKLIGDMSINRRDKEMNDKVIKITNIFIDSTLNQTIISKNKANKAGRFELKFFKEEVSKYQ